MAKKKTENKLDKIKKSIVDVLKKHGIKKAAIFGSFARGEEEKNSDIDILIEFKGSLLTLIGIEIELEKRLRKKIDLITYAGINPHLKEYILKDEVRII